MLEILAGFALLPFAAIGVGVAWPLLKVAAVAGLIGLVGITSYSALSMATSNYTPNKPFYTQLPPQELSPGAYQKRCVAEMRGRSYIPCVDFKDKKMRNVCFSAHDGQKINYKNRVWVKYSDKGPYIIWYSKDVLHNKELQKKIADGKYEWWIPCNELPSEWEQKKCTNAPIKTPFKFRGETWVKSYDYEGPFIMKP